MGVHDTSEIIELTEVIHDGKKDLSREQPLTSTTLEDEFEQLMQDARTPSSGPGVHDDLDIESLFEEMEDAGHSTPTPNADDAPETSLLGQELAGLDELFGSLESSSTPSTDKDAPSPGQKTAEPEQAEQEPAGPGSAATEAVQAESIPEKDGSPDTMLLNLTTRVAALENASVEPDMDTLQESFTAFFEKSDEGEELMTRITSAVVHELKGSAGALIEEKLAALELPSSEEITAMIKDEISSAVKETFPPDADTLAAEIREDFQDQLDTIKGEMLTGEEADILKTEINETLAREIPAAAARIIREEIAALLKG